MPKIAIAALPLFCYSMWEMNKAAEHTTTHAAGAKDNFSTAVLVGDFLGTAWRMAVPVILFAALGIFLDLKLGSKPWITLAGTAIGLVFAALLVKQQMATVLQKEEAPLKTTNKASKKEGK